LADWQSLTSFAGSWRWRGYLLAWFFPPDVLPDGETRLGRGLVEAAAMIRDDAHAHVLLCHVPASFSTRGGWLCGAAA
jgi:hypothetical protein